MAFFVKFWGTRGSIPTPGFLTEVYGGNTPCLEIRIDDVLYICDAGSGIRALGLDLMKRGHSPIVAHLFFSHAHWDHIQGFPFFVPAFIPKNIFYVYGPTPGENKFYRLLSGQMDSEYFPVKFADIGGNIVKQDISTGERIIEGVRVRCWPLIHHGPSFAYCFEKAGYKVVYATDNELDMGLVNKDEAERNLSLMRQIPEQYVKFVQGADLLIADGQYTDEEYSSKVGFGHARATTVVDFAIQAGVKQLAITHHDPLQSDDQVKEKIDICCTRAKKFASDLIVFGAREGVELRID